MPSIPITRVPVDKATLIMSKAFAMPLREATRRAFELLHLDRELTPEENLDLAVHLYEPRGPYIA